jgi:hypothetical protein
MSVTLARQELYERLWAGPVDTARLPAWLADAGFDSQHPSAGVEVCQCASAWASINATLRRSAATAP